MNEILRAPTPSALVTAIEANLFDLSALFSCWPRAQVHDGSDLLWCITDVRFPFFNSIFRAQLALEEVDAAIDAAVARGAAHHVPLMWWTRPATRPADLGSRLEAHGFARERGPTGMAIDLLAMNQAPAAPPGLTIERLENSARIGILGEVCVKGFGMPDFVAEPMSHLFDCLSADARIRHYLGKLDGESVACSMLYLGAGVAGIYNVTALSSARGRGIGAAMTLAPLRDARDLGYCVGILQASEMGFPVYRQLGFQEYCKIGHYIWQPAPEPGAASSK
jgi:GNAT superfamily N-acetyltransferase